MPAEFQVLIGGLKAGFALNSNLINEIWRFVSVEYTICENGFDIYEAAKTVKIQSAMVTPNNIPKQGIPSGFSNYGRYLCIGGQYPVLLYFDVMGRVAYANCGDVHKWYKLTTTAIE